MKVLKFVKDIALVLVICAVGGCSLISFLLFVNYLENHFGFHFN